MEYKVSHLEKAYDRAFDRAAAQLDKYRTLKNQMNANYENMKRHYEENINQLKNEKNYPALSTASPENIVEAVKADMRRELEEEIQRDSQELAEIDKMIARINELEVQAGK